MRAVKTKLKSREGASITFALLIFLVCAVASSIIIVASTAASGRMSKLPEMDQRYYAVTSAAELLKSKIDGEVIVVTARKTGDTVSYTTQYVKRDKQDTEETSDILLDATHKLVKQLVEKPTASPASTPTPVTFSLVPDVDLPLYCKVKEEIKNGLLVYTINNCLADGSDDQQKYTLEVRFSYNIKQSASNSAASTSRTTVTWKFNSMKKISGL